MWVCITVSTSCYYRPVSVLLLLQRDDGGVEPEESGQREGQSLDEDPGGGAVESSLQSTGPHLGEKLEKNIGNTVEEEEEEGQWLTASRTNLLYFE